jgi:hypothetical protein
MSNLINESDKINCSLKHYRDAEELFSVAEHGLADQSTSDGGFSVFLEPLVGFDEEAEAAYKVWQESLTYLQRNVEKCLEWQTGRGLIL